MKLIAPVSAKLHRQPAQMSIAPSKGTPSAGASLAAASKSDVAKLRSCSGNQAPTALAFDGKVGASPTPSKNRAANSPFKLGVTAAPNDATLHRKVPVRP